MGCSASEHSKIPVRRLAGSTRQPLSRFGHTQARSTQVPLVGRRRPQSSPGLPLGPPPTPGSNPGHRLLRPPTFPEGHSPCGSTSAAVFALQGPRKRVSQGLLCRVPRCLGAAAESLEPSGEETQVREEEGFLASLLPLPPAGVGARGAALGRRQRFFVSLAQATRH